MRELLSEIPAIVISPGDRQKVIHGTDLNLLTNTWETDEYRLLDETGDLVALARRLQTFVSPVAQPVHWVRVHPHVIFGKLEAVRLVVARVIRPPTKLGAWLGILDQPVAMSH